MRKLSPGSPALRTYYTPGPSRLLLALLERGGYTNPNKSLYKLLADWYAQHKTEAAAGIKPSVKIPASDPKAPEQGWWQKVKGGVKKFFS